jgi:hypothetical protein
MQVWLGPTLEMARAIADGSGLPVTAPFRRQPPALAWRCVEGQVYACTYGANIPCTAKVNFDTEPTDAMNDYCRKQLAAGGSRTSFVPVQLTGRNRAYGWQCQDGVAVAIGDPAAADAQGYFKRWWFLVAE